METAAHQNPKLAVGVVVAACVALSLGDALVKRYSDTLPLWQILALRSAIAVPFLVYFARLGGCETPVRPAHFGPTLLRSLVLALAAATYLAALPHVPLLLAASAGATFPLFEIALGALFYGRRTGPRDWFALGSGIGGMLLVLQAQSAGFVLHALLPLGAALGVAAATLPGRAHGAPERPTVLALWLNVGCFTVAILALGMLALGQPVPRSVALDPFLLERWSPMRLDEWRIVALLAVLFVVASIGLPAARQSSPVSLVAALSLAYVPLAALWGWTMFDERPAPITLVGAVLVIVAGWSAVRRRRA